jgi:hypothetical protein
MKKILIALALTLVIGAPTLSFATESTSKRAEGEMVKIGGQDRPDLVAVFDTLKATTVMTKGKVYAKEPDSGDSSNTDPSDSLARAVATASVEQSERSSQAKAQTQSKTCMKCPGCGADKICFSCMGFYVGTKCSGGHFDCQPCNGQGPKK